MGDPTYAAFAHHPVAIENRYEEFVNASGLPHSDVWFYYCCGPTGPWPNRFIDYTLVRVRIFTWIAFKLGAPGFLHWGYSHWDWHPPRRDQPYNAYDNTTGGVLQAGDSYVVYPPWNANESAEPVDSIRWEMLREGLEDYEYFYLLRELVSRAVSRGVPNDKITSAQKLLEIPEAIIKDKIHFTRDPQPLYHHRRALAEAIESLQSKSTKP